jgi:hypothetical protein
MTDPTNQFYRVYGTVTDVQGVPAPKILVRAFDRDLRTEEQLGEKLTDDAGKYEILYTPDSFKRAEKQYADLSLKAYDPTGKQLLYEQTIDEITFNAPPEKRVDIIIRVAIKPLENEFDTILRALPPLIENVPLTTLLEDAKTRDITFLTKETGIPSQRLQYIVVAHRLQELSKIDAAFFYGLLRKDTLLKLDLAKAFNARVQIDINADTKPVLYDAALADEKLIDADIKAAIKEMIIPQRVGTQLREIMAMLSQYRDEARRFEEEEKTKRITDTLTNFLMKDKLGEMQQLFNANRQDYTKFLDAISSANFFASTDDKKRTEVTVALGSVLGFNDKIINTVAATQKIDKPQDIKKLAKLNSAAWRDVLTQSSKDLNVDPALIKVHASALARKMETEYPTQAFAAQLERAEEKTGPQHDAIVKLLTENEDFDLQRSNIDTFFRDKGTRDADTTEPALRELKSVQRVFKLVPNYSKTTALLSQKVHSAQSIVATGKTRFVNEVGPAAGISEKEATAIYNKASNVQAASMLIAGELQDTISSMEIAALNVNTLSAKLKAISKDFPNLKSLFQLSDMCACEHCRSVYSPAAYLVELLQYLDKRTVRNLDIDPNAPVRIAKDVLFERRPDLGEIDLGCENANTPLPYIDLVCELLEETISPDAGITYNGALANGKIPAPLQTLLNTNKIAVTDKALVYAPLDPVINPAFYLRDEGIVCKLSPLAVNQWQVKRLHQTFASAEELAAAPEYVNENAYTLLSTQQFAFTLPFNLPHTEALAYFSRFGISRTKLMQDLQKGATPPNEAIAAEILGLTEAERKLIINADAANQELYWNTGAPNAVAYMKVVDNMLRKSGLTYTGLNNLLSLTFINPDNKLFIKHLDTGCDTTQKEIANLDDAALDRIHRFLRLVKLTGWKQEVLNEVIMQTKLGNKKLDDPCLLALSKLQTINQATGIKREELIGFYGEIPHTIIANATIKPLYQQVFLNKATTGFLDETLLPILVDGSTTLNAHAVSLAACLQLSALDLERITGAMANTDLTFENISHLFAVARLCRKLKITVSDYHLYVTLTGLDVFSTPAVTVDFINHVNIAKGAPLKPAEVKFMLRHEADNLAEREITDDKITAFLSALQAGYQQAFNTNKSPYDALLLADELQEPLKNGLAKLPGFTEEITNNFLKMANDTWASPPDPVAATYINDQLLPFFAPAVITNIQALQAAIVAAPPANLEAARKAFLEALFTALSEYFFLAEKTDLLVTSLASTFKAENELVTALLSAAKLKQPAPGTAFLRNILLSDTLIDKIAEPPVPPVITPAGFTQQYNAIRLLHKLFPFVKALKQDPDTIAWILNTSPALGWLEPDRIPYAGAQTPVPYATWESFVQLLSLLNTLTPVPNPGDAENPLTFVALIAILQNAATTRQQWLDAFALLNGYDRDVLDDADLYFGFSNPDLAQYRKVETWIKLATAMLDLRILGTSATIAKEFIKPVLSSTDTSQLRMTLKARYEEDLWLDTLKEIMNTVRPRKRDALVAYLLATTPDVYTPNDLFDYYLVDTQMEAIMPSSRIVQAHGTIQLFVQRCLMGLESTAAADRNSDSGWDQWKWMKNYRVWEANRKVFLYPENWIEPELLDDKSYLFSEMEEQLLQDEVNEFTTEDALIRYLEKLDEIAFLEVVAEYYQADIYTLHVFARTKTGDPATYYYRRLEQERYWSPWEKVDLDITSNQLLAFVHNNRLCLAWPIFSEVPNPTHQVTIPGVSASESAPKDMKKVERKLKIQLAISQFANKQWQPKRVSRGGIMTPDTYVTDKFDYDVYNLMYFEFSQQIMVFHTYIENIQEYHYMDGLFDLAGCKGYPELTTAKPNWFPDFFPDFKDTLLGSDRYVEQDLIPGNALSVRNALLFYNFFDLLTETPGTFRLSYPHQFTWVDMLAMLYQIIMKKLLANFSDLGGRSIKVPLGTLLPYFFENSKHNYVIVPGFYGVDKDPQTGEPVTIRRTYTDVLKLLEAVIALYNKYVQIIKDNPGMPAADLVAKLVADPDFQAIVAEWKVYTQLKYGEQFRNFYHPLLCMMRKTLYKDGIPALMKRETQLTVTNFKFADYYKPGPLVPGPLPIEDIDFNSDGSYSSYNWELFYHTPMMLATRLSRDQRFEEALVWFHYIFNPTGALEGNPPQKYWVTKPFYQRLSPEYLEQRIDNLLTKIADPGTPEIKELEFAIEQWRTKPFMPHVVARFRPVAYQKATLMKYIDNLVQWGDNLFRQDTMESITQATQMYILADKLLGPKPRIIPPAVKVPYETYNQLEPKLDAFGNALLEFENLLPDLSVLPHGGDELPPPPITMSSLYFCVPPNDQMLAWWDVIEDRLFKIRNSQNIDGVERLLALFAPPIDPGMLVRAAAAGLDISSVIAGLNAPLPIYRFNVMAQKATELIQEVRGLGSALLQALEKKDAEALALLRNELEMKLLKSMLDMKKIQLKEAKQQIEVLNRTKVITEERDAYFTAIEKIIPSEQLNLDKLSEAHDFQLAAQIVQATGAVLGLIPDFGFGGHGFGGSPAVDVTWGGTFLATAATAATGVLNILSGVACYEANRASILGGFDRRFSDWKLQERLAKLEIKQIEQQITAAEIRVEINEADIKTQELQIDNNLKTDEFMQDKFTNKDLYQWMIGKISAVYFKAYKLAYDVSKKTERCYQHELGNTDTFLQFGYWDNLKKGLQTADQLFYDLKRMEASYLDTNKREYEVTKHISLSMLDPLALIRLRATGVCDFQVPEALFDMDHPGHYFRRIKTVSITLPCIAGPYTSVSAKLSLINNRYRKNTAKAVGFTDDKTAYEEVPGNDDRFIYNIGTIQSIATSNAQNDSGLFELNFRDERYLPFEYTGAVSTWRLELPTGVRLFDYNTIADVIIHLKYTAREGGSTLKTLASNTLKDKLAEIGQQLNETGLHLALNLRYDMPDEWNLLKKDGTVNMQIAKNRLPYFMQAFAAEIDKVFLLARFKNAPALVSVTIDAASLTLNPKPEWSVFLNETMAIELDTPFTLAATPAVMSEMEELMMIVKYQFP